jgi:hypothetical protein
MMGSLHSLVEKWRRFSASEVGYDAQLAPDTERDLRRTTQVTLVTAAAAAAAAAALVLKYKR